MSPDPIYSGLKEGLSIYGYCRNNPLIYHDPTGLEEKYNESLDEMLKKEVPLTDILEKKPEAEEYLSNLFTGAPNSGYEKIVQGIESVRTTYGYETSGERGTISMLDIIYGQQWDADRPSQLEQALISLAIVTTFAGGSLFVEAGGIELTLKYLAAGGTWTANKALKYGNVVGNGIFKTYHYIGEKTFTFSISPAGQAVFNSSWWSEAPTQVERAWRLGVQALIQAFPQMACDMPTQPIYGDPIEAMSTMIQILNDSLKGH